MRDKILFTFCFVFILVILFTDFYIKEPPKVFEMEVGKKIDFIGIITDEPDIRENNQKLVIEIKKEKIRRKF